MKLYMFRTVRLAIIRSLFTVHSAMLCFIQVCRQLSSRTRTVLLESCLQTCMSYTPAECTVNKLRMMDSELSETCRVSCQNKFVKLVHLFGFSIKKYDSELCYWEDGGNKFLQKVGKTAHYHMFQKPKTGLISTTYIYESVKSIKAVVTCNVDWKIWQQRL
jgi:hypothetical protein